MTRPAPLEGQTSKREAHALQGMVWIEGGTFRMGSDRHYPEEAPAHRVRVDGFWIDRTPVTNRQFREFVEGDRLRHLRRDRAGPEGLSGRPAAHAAGGLAGVQPAEAGRWISATGRSGGRSSSAPTGASPTGRAARSAGSTTIRSCTSPTATPRRTPGGPARSCRPRPNGSSPRAAGWTAPSSPGATSSRPAAGRWRTPGRAVSRTRTPRLDGYERTSPVTAFPPNGYGLHDMIGNVWEWTTDWFSRGTRPSVEAVLRPENPRGGREERATIPASRRSGSRAR